MGISLSEWLFSSCSQSLDEVHIQVETCEELRSISTQQGLSSYGGNAKYSFINKVIDGMTVSVNTVQVTFKSPAFIASVQVCKCNSSVCSLLSHICNCLFRHSFLREQFHLLVHPYICFMMLYSLVGGYRCFWGYINSIFRVEGDGGDTFLWNIVNHLQD